MVKCFRLLYLAQCRGMLLWPETVIPLPIQGSFQFYIQVQDADLFSTQHVDNIYVHWTSPLNSFTNPPTIKVTMAMLWYSWASKCTVIITIMAVTVQHSVYTLTIAVDTTHVGPMGKEFAWVDGAIQIIIVSHVSCRCDSFYLKYEVKLPFFWFMNSCLSWRLPSSWRIL